MAKITMEQQDEILTFPTDSILELKIEEANVETVQGRNESWEKVSLKFKILGIQAIGDGGSPAPYENWIGRNIYGSVPFRLTDSAENKLRMWAEAIFRQELGLGFELDTDLFVGRQVRGITSQYDARAKDANGVPFKRAQVASLLPYGGTTQAQAQPQQAPAQQQPQAPTQDPWAATAASAGNTWGNEDPPF